ncbi:MAG TPA: NADH-quinone oxidoreductase subunit NuoF [Rubricoccaceae bacterium]|nr:NADH-quinone oxidoreductase subunit NuoF [Rubricoccaceae bacterium]
MPDAPSLITGQTKAGDWRAYERVLLPPVRDLHNLKVYEDHGGYEALKAVVKNGKFDPKGLTDEVKASGLRGRGGAGFATGLKWSFMPPVDPEKPRYLCCNGDESEPGTFKDRQLFEYNPHLLIEGIALACYAMTIKTCYLYIRGEYVDYVRHVQRAVDEAYEAGYLGKNILGTDFSTDLVVHLGAGAYICGEETSLMESLEGKRAYPRIKPPFPAMAGLWAMPTTINNVETLACVPLIVNRGAQWFAGLGPEKHPGPMLYGISGHVVRPGVYEYPAGMLISDLIYEVAGGVRGGKKIKAIVPGGSSTPPLRWDQCEGVTMDAETLREAGSSIGTAGLCVLDEDTDMVSWTRRIAHFYWHESCGQCTPCRDGTGWLYKLLTRIDEGEGYTRDLDLLQEICDQMEGRTVCALADAAAWPVRWGIRRFRDEFEAKCKAATFAGADLGGDGSAALPAGLHPPTTTTPTGTP